MSIRPPSPLRSLAGCVKSLFVSRTPRRTVPPRLRGKLRRAVVVPTPDPLFSEAVFILRAGERGGANSLPETRASRLAVEHGARERLLAMPLQPDQREHLWPLPPQG